VITVLDATSPLADAGLDQTVNEETSVTFDGSGSSDNVIITSYNWIFKDITTQNLTGIHLTYNFTTPGLYVVKLIVTDEAGNNASDTVTITVLDLTNPMADAGSNRIVAEDSVVNFDASNSNDNVGIISFEWDFGDRATGTGMTTTHIYTEIGNYTATLTVRDATSHNDTDSIIITVLTDADKDGIPDLSDPDKGGDGMPNTWEEEYGLDPSEPADSSLDPDGDGLINLQARALATRTSLNS
jgi:PKD repeat protein